MKNYKSIMLMKIATIGLLAVSIFLVFYNFIIVPKLIIGVTSNTSGKAQLFYKINDEGSYSELYAEIKDIQKGHWALGSDPIKVIKLN